MLCTSEIFLLIHQSSLFLLFKSFYICTHYLIWSSSISTSGMEPDPGSLRRQIIILTNNWNYFRSLGLVRLERPHSLVVHAALAFSGHIHIHGHASGRGWGHQAGQRDRTALVFLDQPVLWYMKHRKSDQTPLILKSFFFVLLIMWAAKHKHTTHNKKLRKSNHQIQYILITD